MGDNRNPYEYPPQEGMEGFFKKLTMLLPLFFIALNTFVQIKEMTSDLVSDRYTGFDEYTYPTIILDDSDTAVKNTAVDSWPEVQRIDRRTNLLYGYSESTIDTNTGVCTNDGTEFIDAYNDNTIMNYNYVTCDGNATPLESIMTCGHGYHPAFLAAMVVWSFYVIGFSIVIATNCWMTYSIHDVRFYIAAAKFKSGKHLKLWVGIGTFLSLATALTALYYVGDNEEGDWGDTIKFSDLTTIILFLLINAKSMTSLGKSDSYTIDHVDMAKDFPEIIYINTMKEDEKVPWNLFGGLQSVDDVFFLLEQAYLHMFLFGNDDMATEVCKVGNKDTVVKIVNMFHVDNLDAIKVRMEKEYDAMKKDPVLKHHMADGIADDDVNGKMEVVREMSTRHMTPATNLLRKLYLLMPVMLLFVNAFNITQKFALHATYIQHGGFDEGQYVLMTAPDRQRVFIDSQEYPLAPGQVASTMPACTGCSVDYNTTIPASNVDYEAYGCPGWYQRVKDLSYYNGVRDSACESSFPAKVLTATISCPYIDTTLFLAPICIWAVYALVLLIVIVVKVCGYSTNDFRYYLAFESLKKSIPWRLVLNMGYLCTFCTFLTGLAYEAMRPYVPWEDIANMFIYLFLNLQVLLNLDDCVFPDLFMKNVNKEGVNNVFPEEMPVVVDHYSEIKAPAFGGKGKPSDKLFIACCSMYLQSLVKDEPLFITHVCSSANIKTLVEGIQKHTAVSQKKKALLAKMEAVTTTEGELEMLTR